MSGLREIDNKLLSYLNVQEEWITIADIMAYNTNYSMATIYKSIKRLLEYEFIQPKSQGRVIMYKITSKGRSYLKENNISYNFQKDIDSIKVDSKLLVQFYQMYEDVQNVKKSIEKQQENFETQKKEFEDKLDIFNDSIKDAKKRIDTFYGKIGEIISLLIGAISIIVFNIKVMDTTKINFNSGYKDVFMNLIAIDMPLIILLIIAMLLFDFIVDKKLNVKKIGMIIVIVIICIIFLFK